MRALALALVVSALAAPVHAQDDLGAEMLKAFFAMTGIGAPGMPDIDVVVGDVPDQVDAALLPSDAVVLGGISVSPGAEDLGAPNALALARLDAAPEAALAAYAESDPSAEWEIKENAYNPNAVRLCGPEHRGEATFMARRDGGSYVAVVVEEGTCEEIEEALEADTTASVDVPPSFQPIVLPDPFPEGAFADRQEQSFAYSGEGLRGGYLRVEVKEGTSVEAVAELVADAFEFDGWVRLGEAASEGALISTWTRTEESEDPEVEDATALATVRVQPTGEGTIEVLVAATR